MHLTFNFSFSALQFIQFWHGYLFIIKRKMCLQCFKLWVTECACVCCLPSSKAYMDIGRSSAFPFLHKKHILLQQKTLCCSGQLFTQTQVCSGLVSVSVVCLWSLLHALVTASLSHWQGFFIFTAGTEIMDRESIQQERMCSYHSERQRPP